MIEFNNHLLALLAQHSTKDLEAAIAERESEILADIQTARAELEDGKPLVFAFSFSGKLMFDKNKIETAFSYSVKKSQKSERDIGRPDAPEFEVEGGAE